MKSAENSPSPFFRRVMLKLSGEAFAGKEKFGIDSGRLDWIAEQIREAVSLKVGMALVVGGGNFFRGGREGWGVSDRVSVDYLGMLATVMNSVALQEALSNHRVESRVLSAINVPQICEPFIRPRALGHLSKNRVVVLAAGTGNPFFTTDTAATLRALELGCSVLLKATRVKGVYDCDPEKYDRAKFYRNLSYTKALSKDLKVMDATALSLCRDHKLPIIVFNLFEEGNLRKALLGKSVGTLIK
jgi:uridylate kinase